MSCPALVVGLPACPSVAGGSRARRPMPVAAQTKTQSNFHEARKSQTVSPLLPMQAVANAFNLDASALVMPHVQSQSNVEGPARIRGPLDGTRKVGYR